MVLLRMPTIEKKDILILIKGLTNELNNTTITAEAEYSILKCCLSLIYNGSDSYLFLVE